MPAATTDNVLALPRIPRPGVDSRFRGVVAVVTAPTFLEGEGFQVRRPFPGIDMGLADPFLLLDHLGAVEYQPGEANGAPWHPHRGFETDTYIIDGAIEHHDSTGGGGLITDGATQWMTAGSGILHDELPPEWLVRKGGMFHGVQLWVNLPRDLKFTVPRYQDISGNAVKLLSSNDGGTLVRLIAGDLAGEEGPGMKCCAAVSTCPSCSSAPNFANEDDCFTELTFVPAAGALLQGQHLRIAADRQQVIGHPGTEVGTVQAVPADVALGAPGHLERQLREVGVLPPENGCVHGVAIRKTREGLGHLPALRPRRQCGIQRLRFEQARPRSVNGGVVAEQEVCLHALVQQRHPVVGTQLRSEVLLDGALQRAHLRELLGGEVGPQQSHLDVQQIGGRGSTERLQVADLPLSPGCCQLAAPLQTAAGIPSVGVVQSVVMPEDVPVVAPSPTPAPRSTATPRSAPRAGTGRLVVGSDPPRCAVRVDGRPVGNTPVFLNAVAAGERRVICLRPGHLPLLRTVRVERGAEREVFFPAP